MRRLKRAVAIALTVAMMASMIGVLPTDVSAAAGKVKSITIKNIDSNTLVLKKGKTFTLKTVVKTTGKVSKKATYKSSNNKVVKVSAKGKLKALKNGKAKVTVRSVAGKKITVNVIVGTPVKKITLNQTEGTVNIGDKLQLKASVEPKKASYKKVAYISDNETVAAVSSKGLVQAKSAGTAKITVKAKDGSKKSAVCVIHVNDASVTTEVTATTEAAATTTAAAATTASQPTTEKQTTTEAPVEKLSYEGYKQVWEDEFEGDSISKDWNVETHEPGWVNEELQEYTASGNYSVADGKLTIQPKKTVDASGNAHYTSARLNTQGHQEYTYGLFEVVAKVPEGKGFLPAFWLLSDENRYGQWPRCGEIDAMEVMGQETNKVYGTIHYGNPHSQSQGTYTLSEGSCSEDYHKFSCEWEPGKITWYIDGIKYHEESDWYSKTAGQGTLTYPAPFDQPFYMILNLAVGGSWVGYPDEDQDINSQSYSIDSVRVYQKESGYDDSNVKKPQKELVLREPVDGNYVYNADFAEKEDLTDDENWKFLTAKEGEGSASISNNEIVIETKKAGTDDYSIQLVQAGIPAEQGGTYKLTFDAYADEARTMKVDVSAPDRSFSRYLNDTEVELTTEKKPYEYEYTVTDDTDANSRLEFNLGNTDSTATVRISNVRIEKKSQAEISDAKTVLADGNYVYNGSFQEGENRLGYWETSEGVKTSVTKLDDGRRCKAEVSSGNAVISQDALALTAGDYAYSMNIQGAAGQKVVVSVAGVEKTFTLEDDKATEVKDTFTITADDLKANSDFSICFVDKGTYYIDNVRLVEDALIKNGNFNAGAAGYDIYVDSSASASYVVDTLNEDNALDLTIKNTSDQEWKIQVKQTDVALEKGQWYNLSFDIKSSIDRNIQYSIQRDGATHKTETGGEDWTPYTQDTVSLTAYGEDGKYTTISNDFQMKEEDDNASIFNIALGGKNITEQHRVCIDNIKLVKIDEPPKKEIEAGVNLFKNPDFSNGEDGWDIYAITSPAVATTNIADNKIVYSISSVGDEDWNVQLKQKEKLTLEKGASYKLTFKAKSTKARTIKAAFLNTSYDWYGGADIALAENEEKQVEVEFTVTDKETADDITFVVSMGQIKDNDGNLIDTPASDITLSDFSLVKLK